jgi:hypothetical protein
MLKLQKNLSLPELLLVFEHCLECIERCTCRLAAAKQHGDYNAERWNTMMLKEYMLLHRRIISQARESGFDAAAFADARSSPDHPLAIPQTAPATIPKAAPAGPQQLVNTKSEGRSQTRVARE